MLVWCSGTDAVLLRELVDLEVGQAQQVLPGVLRVVLLVARVAGQAARQRAQPRVRVVVAQQQRVVGQLAHVHHHGHAALLRGRADLETTALLVTSLYPAIIISTYSNAGQRPHKKIDPDRTQLRKIM